MSLKLFLFRILNSRLLATGIVVAQDSQKNNSRIEREKRLVSSMIALYCKTYHGGSKPCSECQELLSYALLRLDCCSYGEQKPACLNCPIHCYKAQKREQIREVMRTTGKRMLWHHPWLALLHLYGQFFK